MFQLISFIWSHSVSFSSQFSSSIYYSDSYNYLFFYKFLYFLRHNLGEKKGKKGKMDKKDIIIQ